MKSSSINRIMALLGRSNDLVACNVYISAGKPHHLQELLHVLESSQQLCRQLRSSHTCSADDEEKKDYRVAIVHAYADGPYERSSLHLAGRAEFVAQVACHVAITAIDSLSQCHANMNTDTDDDDDDNNNDSKHPLVGLVDHISIMPLETTKHEHEHEHEHQNDKAMKENDNIQKNYIPPDANGLAALSVAHALTQKGVQCVPYGTADQHHTPLSIVRREKTGFFRSGGLSEKELNESKKSPISIPSPSPSPNPSLGICTVGSPSHFVENFNIRLSNKISKKQAMTLTKRVRERDGGLLGVEALTLPYSHGRYEVACNLLRPDSSDGNVDSIRQKVEEWVQEQTDVDDDCDDVCDNDTVRDKKKFHEERIDEAYRVGTTISQCLETMGLDDDDMLRDHDALVMDKFRSYVGS